MRFPKVFAQYLYPSVEDINQTPFYEWLSKWQCCSSGFEPEMFTFCLNILLLLHRSGHVTRCMFTQVAGRLPFQTLEHSENIFASFVPAWLLELFRTAPRSTSSLLLSFQFNDSVERSLLTSFLVLWHISRGRIPSFRRTFIPHTVWSCGQIDLWPFLIHF